MAEERGSFRRRVFGGFDRNDVINYIETIAVQRNEYQARTKELTQEANELRVRLDDLTVQLNNRDTMLADNAKKLDSAKKELDDVWKELREALDELDVIKGQLEQSSKELNAKTTQYEKELSAAQAALRDAKSKCEQQRIAAINNASGIVTALHNRYKSLRSDTDSAADSFRRGLDSVSDNMSAMSVAFADAEDEFKRLLTDKEI